MKTVGKLVEKCEKRLAANIQAYEDNKDYERLRLYGELITSSIYNLKKGMSSARIPNYHSEDQEFAEIPLDPKKSPQENAQYYFKCYGKARTAFNYAVSQIENLKIELSWLESVMLAIERVKTAASFMIFASFMSRDT